MSNKIVIDEGVFKQTQEALELAMLMLDGENQPPQFTTEEAHKAIEAAHDALVSNHAPHKTTRLDRT
jgi:hypothetical protein